MEWKNKAKQYTKLTALCMNENYFMFRERYVKTTSGVAMRNPLFPLTSEIFMSPIEQKGNGKKSCIQYNEPPTLGSLTRKLS